MALDDTFLGCTLASDLEISPP